MNENEAPRNGGVTQEAGQVVDAAFARAEARRAEFAALVADCSPGEILRIFGKFWREAMTPAQRADLLARAPEVRLLLLAVALAEVFGGQ